MAKVNKIHIFADVSKYIIKLINDHYKNIQHALSDNVMDRMKKARQNETITKKNI